MLVKILKPIVQIVDFIFGLIYQKTKKSTTTGSACGNRKTCTMDYFRPKVTPATEKTRWTSASRGNRWILETYLPTDQENVSLETPEFVVTQPVITSFWNFLNTYEDPELNREKLPIQGLAMLLMGLRKQSSEECWDSFIWKTSQFIKRIVKRKFQKQKEVWAELLRVVYSAHQTLSVRSRNGIFNGRCMRELFNHCNGVVSDTNRVIHDILPDPDGRGIDLLLEQLSTTRKPNGLWIISLHRRNGAPNKLVVPGSLPSRAESIELAKLWSPLLGLHFWEFRNCSFKTIVLRQFSNVSGRPECQRGNVASQKRRA